MTRAIPLCFLALATAALAADQKFQIPPDYLVEEQQIPSFWVSTVQEVNTFLNSAVKKGSVTRIGATAGGRPLRCVAYGRAREGKGTTTFSGSLGFGDVKAFLGPDAGRKVYLGMAAVHGGELEPIVGIVNLISVLETGKDLRGKPWPDIVDAAAKLDRILLIPIVNVDGRARVPYRMLRFRGENADIIEYFNTGGWPNGKIIGWPDCKQFIPLDFKTTQFPGGYPNDAGVNIQHDDFFGAQQPETRALFQLAARERPDLILNMHTGAQFAHMLRPTCELALSAIFDTIYSRVQTGLTEAHYQATEDPAVEGNASRERLQPYNLDTALNLHCGALAATVESPSHGFTTAKRNGKMFRHTPDDLVNIQLIAHREAMKFLAEAGGRANWTPVRER